MSDQKAAIVTGASRGIGAAVAERLARDDFAVVINYAGSTGAAEALATKIVKAGGRAIIAQPDATGVHAPADDYGLWPIADDHSTESPQWAISGTLDPLPSLGKRSSQCSPSRH